MNTGPHIHQVTPIFLQFSQIPYKLFQNFFAKYSYNFEISIKLLVSSQNFTKKYEF